MPNVYFTSDTHLGHARIVTIGAGRPFKTIQEHDAELIKRWNERVKPDDVVFHLGDFNYKSSVDADFYLKQLNGRKFLIVGNHDKQKTITADGWEVAPLPYQELELNGMLITLCHYPIEEWNGYHKGSWMLHGHVHGMTKTVPIRKNRVDVGVDNFNFAPATFEEIQEFNRKALNAEVPASS
jgi:calcineurin-like phosphoesterase family protein